MEEKGVPKRKISGCCHQILPTLLPTKTGGRTGLSVFLLFFFSHLFFYSFSTFFFSFKSLTFSVLVFSLPLPLPSLPPKKTWASQQRILRAQKVLDTGARSHYNKCSGICNTGRLLFNYILCNLFCFIILEETFCFCFCTLPFVFYR